MTPTEFLTRARDAAESARRDGAPIMPAAAAAHAANETGYGRSQLSTSAHNLFGVKALGRQNTWWHGESISLPTWEVIDGKRVDIHAAFRAYDSWASAFGDYGDLINRLYPSAANARSDVGFLAGLFLTGPRKWATDPAAFEKACRILAENEAALIPPDTGSVGYVGKLVLHQFPLAYRWAILTSGTPTGTLLTGKFKYNIRGDKLDLKRER